MLARCGFKFGRCFPVDDAHMALSLLSKVQEILGYSEEACVVAEAAALTACSASAAEDRFPLQPPVLVGVKLLMFCTSVTRYVQIYCKELGLLHRGFA